jgi:hypothetical protein
MLAPDSFEIILASDPECVPVIINRSKCTGRDRSPLVPVWVEQNLYPGRGAPMRGLEAGFMPWQLRNCAIESQEVCKQDFWESQQEGQGKPGGLDFSSTVDPDILGRSEFLLPLRQRELEMYRRICENL